jgi:hypothetical protein
MTEYGPVGFGLVSVLVIWQLVVKPQLEKSRVDYKLNQEFALQAKETAVVMKATADTLVLLASNLKEMQENEKEILNDIRVLHDQHSS